MVKSSLQDAMSKVANRTPKSQRATAPRRKPQPEPEPPAFVRPKGREGKKVISGFFDPEASRQLSRLAIDLDRTNEDMLREALNDLFAKYHLPSIG